MKIGILVGRVPPPVFINQLLCGLAEAGHKVFLYGSSNDKNFRYNKPLIFVLLLNTLFIKWIIILNWIA